MIGLLSGYYFKSTVYTVTFFVFSIVFLVGLNFTCVIASDLWERGDPINGYGLLRHFVPRNDVLRPLLFLFFPFLLGIFLMGHQMEEVSSIKIGNEPIVAGHDYTCEGTIVGEVKDGRNNLYFDFDLRACADSNGGWSESRGTVRLYLPFSIKASDGEACRVGFKAMKKIPSFSERLLKNKIGGAGWVASTGAIAGAEHIRPAFWDEAAIGVRLHIGNLLERSMGRDERAISKALLLGERRGIQTSLRDSFSNAGISHLIAISGLHVGLAVFLVIILMKFFSLFYPDLYLLFPRQSLEALVSLPVIWVYLLLADFPVSGVRAGIMLTVYLVGIMMGKKRNFINSVAAALIFILAFDPLSIFSISLQLSVLAVLAIFAALWLVEKGPRIFFMSAAASIGTAPLVGYYFGKFTFIGFFVNLAAIPLTGFFILPLLLIGGIFGFIHAPLAVIVFRISSIGTGILIWSARFASEKFGFFVLDFKPNWLDALLLYALMGVLLLYAKIRRKKELSTQ